VSHAALTTFCCDQLRCVKTVKREKGENDRLPRNICINICTLCERKRKQSEKNTSMKQTFRRCMPLTLKSSYWQRCIVPMLKRNGNYCDVDDRSFIQLIPLKIKTLIGNNDRQ
jgi:hypothetical protein